MGRNLVVNPDEHHRDDTGSNYGQAWLRHSRSTGRLIAHGGCEGDSRHALRQKNIEDWWIKGLKLALSMFLLERYSGVPHGVPVCSGPFWTDQSLLHIQPSPLVHRSRTIRTSGPPARPAILVLVDHRDCPVTMHNENLDQLNV